MTDKQLARDVATELARRMRRRRLVGLGAAIGLVVLAVFYLTCGRGWGLGGPGTGKRTGTGVAAAVADAGPRVCTVRVTATGLVVDGKPATRDEVVAACRATTGAEIFITGDARQGDWDDLHAALAEAHVALHVSTP
jgi:hypothetical protein